MSDRQVKELRDKIKPLPKDQSNVVKQLEADALLLFQMSHILQSEFDKIDQFHPLHQADDHKRMFEKYVDIGAKRAQEPKSLAHWNAFKENYLRWWGPRLGYYPEGFFIDLRKHSQLDTEKPDDLHAWFIARFGFEKLHLMWEMEDYEAKIRDLDQKLLEPLSEDQRSHLTTERALCMDRLVVLRDHHQKLMQPKEVKPSL